MKDREFLNHIHKIMEDDYNMNPLSDLMLKLRAIELSTDKFKDSTLTRVHSQKIKNTDDDDDFWG